MKASDISRMAREAGFSLGERDLHRTEIYEFAKLVAAAERESCAMICDTVGQRDTSFEAEDCALEIRASATSLTS